MNNAGINKKDNEILRNLKLHMDSLPERKPCDTILPECECIQFFSPLIAKEIISGTKICLFCNALTGTLNWKSKECPFLKD